MTDIERRAIEFFEILGGLHDAKITDLYLHASQCRIEIEVDDMYSNFFGLTELSGIITARLVWIGVTSLQILDVNFLALNIFEMSLKTIGSGMQTDVKLWPHGHIAIEHGGISLPEIDTKRVEP